MWHFMRRMANGCTSESHPLYGPFMSRLSAAIFERDKGDVDLLLTAKRSELVAAGVLTPSQVAVQKAVSKMAKHCQRRTRGTKDTSDAIEELLLSFSMAKDSLDVPILKDEMKLIWSEQSKQLACLQDPPGIWAEVLSPCPRPDPCRCMADEEEGGSGQEEAEVTIKKPSRKKNWLFSTAKDFTLIYHC